MHSMLCCVLQVSYSPDIFIAFAGKVLPIPTCKCRTQPWKLREGFFLSPSSSVSMATYCCEEVMPLALAIHRELSLQKKRRRAIDGTPFHSPSSSSDSPPLSFPLPQPALPDSFLLLERDISRKRLQDAAVASRRGHAAHASLETIPGDVAMQREIWLRRRAEKGPSPPRCYSAPPHPNVPGAERRNPRCLPETTAASNSVNARTAQSGGSFGESSSSSFQVRDGKTFRFSAFCL